jgi:nucleoside-triphosphatase
MTEDSPLLFVVTGSRGAGKTSFCANLTNAAREAGWQVTGLLSHPVFEEGTRVAIQAEDLSSGERRQLAVRSETPTPGSNHWQFDRDTLTWGSAVLQAAVPAELLMIDELGPLEFDHDSGWQAGLEAVDSGQYEIAFVVVRAEMLGYAMLRWSDANIVEIDTPEESRAKAKIIAEQLF